MIIISFLSVGGLVHGRGPFNALGSQNSMFALQLFLIFVATPFMILTAIVEDRKLAGEQLARLSRGLIEAQEEERKRIARDVHDDYSQRLAMLAIDVENLAEKVGDSSGGTKQELLTSTNVLANWALICILCHTNCILPRLKAWGWLRV